MIAIPNFRTLRQTQVPHWLSKGEGALTGYALDVLKDGFAHRAYKGLLARFPQNDPTGETTAPEDALAAMGRDRRVVRGLGETPPSFARRLIRWLDDRRRAGNAFALMQKLSEYVGPETGASFRTVDRRGNWFSRAADGTESYLLRQANWYWDGEPVTKWSRFWVIIYPGTRWLPAPQWNAGGSGPVWGQNDISWGSTATGNEVRTVRSIIADWKPAGTRCVGIILAFDPASFEPSTPPGDPSLPDGTWGLGYKLSGGISVPSRLSTAIYWDGVKS